MRANRTVGATALVIAAALASPGVAQAQWSPALAEEWDKYRVMRQQQTLDRTERAHRQMEAAYRRGDCIGLNKIRDDLISHWRKLYSTVVLTAPNGDRTEIKHTVFHFFPREQIDSAQERLNEISGRPCPPGSRPSDAVESVLDDLTRVVVLDSDPQVTSEDASRKEAERRRKARGAEKTPARPSNEPGEEAETPQRVENIREELEASRQRNAELRRKAREQLNSEQQTLLDLHNRARSQVGSPPLEWDPQLAAQAASYGPALAQHGRPVHSPREGRETSRENLLQALPGTPAEKMIAVWTAERQHFVPGTFPDVSRTGNWADVGHYTQMVWPETTSVGCAIHRGGPFDWLICRYSPPGNQDGKPVLAAPRAQAR